MFKPFAANEFIDSLAEKDPFFKAADDAQKEFIANSIRFGVWEAGPHVVVLLNAPFMDLPRNQAIANFLGQSGAEIPPTHICSGILARGTTSEGRVNMADARMQYAFSSPEAAEWFKDKIAEKFGITDTACFEMTDAGPDTRVFTPHGRAGRGRPGPRP